MIGSALHNLWSPSASELVQSDTIPAAVLCSMTTRATEIRRPASVHRDPLGVRRFRIRQITNRGGRHLTILSDRRWGGRHGETQEWLKRSIERGDRGSGRRQASARTPYAVSVKAR